MLSVLDSWAVSVVTCNEWDDSSLSLKDVQDRVENTTVFFFSKSMTAVAESEQNQHIQDLLND